MQKGRPPGSNNRLKAGQLSEGLSDRGIDWIEETVRLYRDGNDEMKFRLLRMWADYLYAKRRPEDASGEAEQPLFGAVPLSNEDFVDLIQKTRNLK